MTTCPHCNAVREVQASLAWGGQTLNPAMPFPDKYWSAPDSPGRYDTDPGPCPCTCHDVWRQCAKFFA